MSSYAPLESEYGLFTDLYELTMAQAYWSERLTERATFSLFFRKLPASRNLALACGQEDAARLATEIRFPRAQLDRLDRLGGFRDDFLRWLEDFRFSGDIRTLPEGTPVFPQEPVLEVDAPVIEAQLLESILMNLVNLETVLASKALRVVQAAAGRPVMDFGMRRMHGMDAALRGVRAYRVAGISGTSNVLASLRHDLPARGTMAHSYIQAHPDEAAALRAFARLYPGTTLLVDTYDTLNAVEKVIRLVRDEGLEVGAIRLDSGDIAVQAREARARLDAAGLDSIRIVASGGLDESRIQALLAEGAPIDGFGVGTDLGSSSDAPSLDFAYKLTEYAGQPRLKNSPGKPMMPGRKQVWRFRDPRSGQFTGDEITTADETRDAEALLRPAVENGVAATTQTDPDEARARCRRDVARLPDAIRGLEAAATPYPVTFSERLERLREQALAGH